tara:strand:- start:38 stop:397 length:360 start_codon:yes stop_codon:yes gene_type:complete
MSISKRQLLENEYEFIDFIDSDNESLEKKDLKERFSLDKYLFEKFYSRTKEHRELIKLNNNKLLSLCRIKAKIVCENNDFNFFEHKSLINHTNKLIDDKKADLEQLKYEITQIKGEVLK